MATISSLTRFPEGCAELSVVPLVRLPGTLEVPSIGLWALAVVLLVLILVLVAVGSLPLLFLVSFLCLPMLMSQSSEGYRGFLFGNTRLKQRGVSDKDGEGKRGVSVGLVGVKKLSWSTLLLLRCMQTTVNVCPSY